MTAPDVRRHTALRAAFAVLLVATAFARAPTDAFVGADAAVLSPPPGVIEALTAPVTPPGAPAEYRPLSMLTHALLGAVAPGPGPERWLSLGLHLAAVGLVATLARRLGVPGGAAWLGAAVFGAHPAVTEVVCLPGARGEGLAAVLALAGWLALLAERQLAAGLLLALTPFCSEAFLLVPITALAWMWSLRKLERITLLLCWAGSGLYLWARHAAGLDAPAWGSVGEVLGTLGALAVRGAALLTDPRAPDAAVALAPNLPAGVALLAFGVGLFVVARGRPWLVPQVAPLILVLPWVPVARAAGMVSDQAFYPLAAGLGLGVAWLARGIGRRPVADLAWVLPVALAFFTGRRAEEWTDGAALYGEPAPTPGAPTEEGS